MYKRTPEAAKAAGAELQAAFALLQRLWVKDYQNVWPALQVRACGRHVAVAVRAGAVAHVPLGCDALNWLVTHMHAQVQTSSALPPLCPPFRPLCSAPTLPAPAAVCLEPAAAALGSSAGGAAAGAAAGAGGAGVCEHQRCQAGRAAGMLGGRGGSE